MKTLLQLVLSFLVIGCAHAQRFAVVVDTNGVLTISANGQSTNFFQTNLSRLIATAHRQAWSNMTVQRFWAHNVGLSNVVVTNMTSPGAGVNSELLGLAATASGENSIAIGYLGAATGDNTVALGDNTAVGGEGGVGVGSGASTSADNAIAIGGGSPTAAYNAIAIGYGAAASASNSMAVGGSVTTSTANEYKIGTATTFLTIPGRLDSAVANFKNLVGSNHVSGHFSYTAGSVSTLANGHNAITLPTNEVVLLSGHSAASFVDNLTNTLSSTSQRRVVIINTGPQLTFVNESGFFGDPGTRLRNSSSADVAIPQHGTAIVQYDSAISRWRMLSPTLPGNTNTASFVTNNFVLNQYYTNDARLAWVSASIDAPAGAQASLWLDQDADGGWERTGITATNSQQLSAFIQPSARFLFTNQAGSPVIRDNSSQWVKQ